MTNPDFRALCAELVAALDPKVVGKDGYGPIAALLPRARAALAQPEPVAVVPTESDVTELFYRHMGSPHTRGDGPPSCLTNRLPDVVLPTRVGMVRDRTVKRSPP